LPFQADDLTLMFFCGVERPPKSTLPARQGLPLVVEPAAQLLELMLPVGSRTRLWGSGPDDLSAWRGQFSHLLR
jgi:hypothetical protein